MKTTKEFILKTAYNMFSYNNYEAVTINDIIKATGLIKGGIYHYFSSKEELFKAVVDKYMLENSVSTEVTSTDLKSFLKERLEYAKYKITRLLVENPDWNREIPINHLSLIVDAYRHYPGYNKIGGTFFQNQLKVWENALKEAIKKGEIRPDIDVEATACNFLIVGAALVTNMFSGGSLSYAINMFERQYAELYKCLKQ